MSESAATVDKSVYDALKEENEYLKSVISFASLHGKRGQKIVKDTIASMFGSDEYERLVEMGETGAIKQIVPIDDTMLHSAALIKDLIQKDKIYVMNKHYGTYYSPSSRVLGFKNGKLLITIDS
jgi:hypothetical protein